MTRSLAAATCTAACAVACAAGPLAASSAARTDVQNPCTLVPMAAVRAALHVRTAPTAVPSSVPNAMTCNYASGKLTIEIGLTAYKNLAPAAKQIKVATLPNGLYTTYAHTTQTQLTFIEGTAAAGTYVVIRQFTRVPQKKLVKLGTVVHKLLATSTAS
jgi:hypothetical protein